MVSTTPLSQNSPRNTLPAATRIDVVTLVSRDNAERNRSTKIYLEQLHTKMGVAIKSYPCRGRLSKVNRPPIYKRINWLYRIKLNTRRCARAIERKYQPTHIAWLHQFGSHEKLEWQACKWGRVKFLKNERSRTPFEGKSPTDNWRKPRTPKCKYSVKDWLFDQLEHSQVKSNRPYMRDLCMSQRFHWQWGACTNSSPPGPRGCQEVSWHIPTWYARSALAALATLQRT